jgi:outer membrane protein assembly factor BamD (BamD/ComL family)
MKSGILSKGRAVAASVLCAVALCALAACAGIPKDGDLSRDMSAKEIIQRAQEASDQYKYKTAAAYYQICLDRNQDDPSIVCSCEYEIAFLAYKQGNYPDSKARFDALLQRYASPDAALLPQEFKILAEKILPKVEAKLAKGKK